MTRALKLASAIASYLFEEEYEYDDDESDEAEYMMEEIQEEAFAVLVEQFDTLESGTFQQITTLSGQGSVVLVGNAEGLTRLDSL